ncbi:MAG: CotH kinase family protein [Pirellulaceae bacterium]
MEFENADWEKELEAFHGTDVDVPARMTVDGKSYENVGVHFRGMSSYGMVPTGMKRSLNLSVDYVHSDQELYGYSTLNLLNANGDASLMSTVLYSQIARKYIPAPKANFVHVVINGESWGVFTNVQQFNKDFIKENFGTKQGNRWKVRGNPGADGGLRDLGDDIEEYKRRYTIKSDDSPEAWQDLIRFCKILNSTPPESLESELANIADVDSILWFLALDVALVNSDGYWTSSQ